MFFIRNLLVLCVIFFVSIASVFWMTIPEKQEYIRDNLDQIEDLPIPESVIDDFESENPSSTVFDGLVNPTYGDLATWSWPWSLSSLISDGLDWPITRSAFDAISTATTPTPPVPPVPPTPPVPPSAPGPCDLSFDENGTASKSLEWALDDCLKWTDLVNAEEDLALEWVWAKRFITDWTTNIATLLGLLAVWAIVYGWLLMTLSWGEDEKIKKWKDIVKWAIIGFLWVLFAGVLIRLVVEVIFFLAS